LLPSGLVVRVLAGPGRGLRWLPESMPHGAWLGTLERSQLDGFVVRIVPGTTVWDVGAHVGLYTRLSYPIASLQPGTPVDVATEWIAEGR
jgi:hypothetical protein